MDDPLAAAALAHRERSHEKRGKIVCVTRADEQLAIQQLLQRHSAAKRAPAPAANSRAQRLRQRRAAGLPLAEPVAQPLGGPARELPESVLAKMSVAYTMRDDELQPIILRSVKYKGEWVLRRVVPIEDLRAAIDIQYTFNAGKKSGMNNLEHRVSRLWVGVQACRRWRVLGVHARCCFR